MPANAPFRPVTLLLPAVCALLCITAAPLFAHNPPPKFSIPLDALAIQSSPDRAISATPFTTINFVDNQHLLVTYAVRRLMKRIPGDPPGDQDRVVEADLLEIPSGKILATTEWRLHDHDHYLWDIGQGHFLLRIRNIFTTFAPMVNLETGHPFDEKPFLHSDERRIVALQLSPDADFLTVETAPIPPPDPGPVHTSPMAAFNAAVSGSGPVLQQRQPFVSGVQIMFYRLSPDPRQSDRIVPRVAGAALTRTPVAIPANSTGFISVLDQGPQTWAFDVTTYAGKVYELPLFNSSCRPASAFVSKAEFVVFGCRGGTDPRRFAAFNLRGDEMWEKSFYDTFVHPSFAFATSTGRFAISRLIVSSNLAGIADITDNEVSGQTIDVFQTADGAQLLHLDCAPAEPGSQNFALSPDGMTVALRDNGAIDIYTLPALTKKEQAAVQQAISSAPQESEVPVRFEVGQTPPSNSATAETTSPLPQPQAPTPHPAQPIPETASADPTPQSTSVSGDAPIEAHRKPPTLYNEPGEHPPDNRDNTQPQ